MNTAIDPTRRPPGHFSRWGPLVLVMAFLLVVLVMIWFPDSIEVALEMFATIGGIYVGSAGVRSTMGRYRGYGRHQYQEELP